MSRRKKPRVEPFVFWVDRCLGTRVVPDALEEAGVEIRRYVDLYPDDPEVEDVVWIPEVTAKGWVILTQDAAISRNTAEIEVLRRAKLRLSGRRASQRAGTGGVSLEALAHRRRAAQEPSAARDREGPPLGGAVA